MSTNYGDRNPNAIVFMFFNTAGADGVLITPLSLAVAATVDDSTTPLTTGVTLTVDHDGIDGRHMIEVDTAASPNYAAGTVVHLFVTAGTADGVSLVGYEVGFFTLRAGAALMPTTAGNTLDVTAGGNAGIDAGNVENQGATLALTATTVAAATTLGTTGIDAILDRPIAQPSAVFTWGAATLRNIIQWLGVMSKNKILETADLQTVRNEADAADLATAVVSDDGTTGTRGTMTS